MHRKNKLGSALTAILLSITGTFVTVPSAVASGPTLTKGSLDLVSDFWDTSGSSPEELIAVGDALYFTADTDRFGRELYRYQDDELTHFDLFPGQNDMDLAKLFEFDGGVGFTIKGYFDPDDRDHVIGYLKGDEARWIRNDDLQGDLSDPVWNLSQSYAAGIGNRMFVANWSANSIFELNFNAVSEYANDLVMWDIVVTDGQTPSPAEDISEIWDLASIGSYLVAWMELNNSGDFEIYVADTREEEPVWTRLVQSPPSGQDTNYIPMDDSNLWVVFDNALYKFALNQDGDLVPAELFGGNSSLTYANGFNQSATAGGEFFFQDDSTGSLNWVSSEGIVEIDDTAADIAYVASIAWDPPAVLDGVLYFNSNERLAAWDYGENRLYPAVEINSPLALHHDRGGTHAFGHFLAFAAETGKGTEVVVVDTLDDSVQVLDIEQAKVPTLVIDAAELDGNFYHFTTTPEPNICYLYRGSGSTATIVRDANNNPIRHICAYDAREEFPNIIEKFGSDLYFMALGNIEMNRLTTYYEPNTRLWKIAAGETVPQLVAWPNAPQNLNNGASLSRVGGSNDFYIRFFTTGSNGLWYFDPATSSGVEPVTKGSSLNTYSPVPTGIVVMADSHYGITPNSGTTAIKQKLFRITDSGAAIDPVITLKSAADSSTTLTSAQQDGIKFLKLVQSSASNVAFALIENWPGAANSITKAVARVERKVSGIELEIVAVGASGYKVETFSYVQNGPGGAPHLLVHFWKETSPFGGRLAYTALSGAFNPTALVLDFNFTEVFKIDTQPLDAQYDHTYIADAGLIITQGNISGEYGHFVFEQDDFTAGQRLANLAGDEWFYLGDEVSMKVESYGFNDKIGNDVYLTVMDGPNPSYIRTYKYNPYSEAVRYNTTSPVYSTLVADGLFSERVLPRPSGSAHNAALDPNYLGGPARQVMRSATPANLNGSAFTRSGYTLSGWATSPNGSVVYQPNGSYPFTQSDILYAVWQQQTTVVTVPVPVAPGNSRVSFSTGEGVSQPAAQEVKTGELVRLPRVTKPGYEFLGWSEAATGLLFTEGYRPADSITLVARFQPMTVKIFLAPQTGIEMPVSVTYTSGQKLDLPKPTKKDHTFVAWVNAETGQRITSEWLPTESVMLAPLFRAGSADEVINFWRNSKFVSNTQLRKLSALVADEALINGRRTIVIRGFDIRNKDLARGRALSVAIKLRKLGVTDRIVLETELGGRANKAEIVVN